MLALVWDKQVTELYDKIEEIDHDCSLDLKSKIYKQDQVRKQIKALSDAYSQASLSCKVCGNRERDLTYVPAFDTWYCEPCYLFNQGYYKRHPEEADWKVLYP